MDCFKHGFYVSCLISLCVCVDSHYLVAGLKILRCCEHCDIIGVIKGEKKFKGAHWHCYRCRNGFNRRDEAIKHYKTHFRNPQTTFQISITQVGKLSIMFGVCKTSRKMNCAVDKCSGIFLNKKKKIMLGWYNSVFVSFVIRSRLLCDLPGLKYSAC